MDRQRTKIPRNVIVVALVALASGFGQDLITPALPAYLVLLGVGGGSIGLIDGLLAGATSLARLGSGIVSDRIRNRKGLVLIGYALSSVTRPLLALFAAFAPIAALRIADGLGKGTKDAPRDALVADSARSHEVGRAFGFQRFVDTAGSVIGPLVASALLLAFTPSLATYRTIFLLSAIPGAVALALVVFGIRETGVREQGPSPGGRMTWRFWVFAAATALAMLTKVNDSLFLVRAADAGISRALIPAVFAGFTLIYALASYPIGILSDRYGKVPFIVTGWLLLAVVEFGFSFDLGLLHALPLLACYGIFYALTEGSGRSFIAELVPQGSRGTAFAIYHSFSGVAVILGGFGIGRLWDVISPQFAFRISTIGSLVACILFATVAFGKRQSPQTAVTQ
jgi:MFS family permease